MNQGSLFFVILIAYTLLQGNAQIQCVLWQDTFVTFSNNSGNFSLDIFSSERKGWVGIGFGKNQSHKLDVIAYLPKNILFYPDHDKLEKNFSMQGSFDTFYGYELDNIFHFSINVPQEFFLDVDTIFFARSFQLSPSGRIFSNHEKVGRRFLPWDNRSSFVPPGWCVPTWLKLPGRAGARHIASFIIIQIFSISIFILMILMRDEQPFKSRGLSPIINIIVFSIEYHVEYILAHAFTFEESLNIECIISSIILYPSQLTIGMCIFFQLVRYILVININIQKERIYKSGNDSGYLVKVLNVLQNQNLAYILPIFYLFLYYLMWIISYLILGFQCGKGQNIILKIFYFGSIGVFLFIIIILQLYDAIQNIKLLLKCQLKRFLIIQDPYFFRLETMSISWIIFPLIVWFLPLPTLFVSLLIDILHLIVLYNIGSLALMISIYRYYFKRNPPQTKDSLTLEKLFKKKDDLLELFIEFSRYEWSLENVYFRLDVEKYVKSSNKPQIYQEIQRKYLNFKNSVYEINVDEKSIQIVETKANNHHFTNDLFDGLMKTININLSDTFLRFIISDMYGSYKMKMEYIKN